MALIATAAAGLEAVVAREVHALGYPTTHTVVGGVRIDDASVADIPRLNLNLRSADRVRLVVGSFQATTFDALFEGTRALPWADLLPRDAVFPVDGRSVKSQLSSVPDCQAIVKRAVVEALRGAYGPVERFPETGNLYRIEVALRENTAILSLDTSGDGLHKRGYRAAAGGAPLRETLAAALVLLSYWHPDRPLVDLFCGSGTIPIEAALIGRNVAPGLRRRFAAEAWPAVGRSAWDAARQEAMDRADWDRPLDIIGSDLDPKMVALATANAATTGVASGLRFKQRRATDFHPRQDYGVIVSNPPYGERDGDFESVARLHHDLRRALAPYPTWSHYWLSGHPEFERTFGRTADRRRKLYNAGIRCQYYQYYGPPPPRGVGPGASSGTMR
ncbi:MAG: class I SAM-dependent RNA methyltransferase [Ardenticatenales bacterium]